MGLSPLQYMLAAELLGQQSARTILQPRKRGVIPCIHCGVFVRESDAVCMSCHRDAPGAAPVHIFGKAIT